MATVMREGAGHEAAYKKLMHHSAKAAHHRAMGRAHHKVADRHEEMASQHAEKIAEKAMPKGMMTQAMMPTVAGGY